MKSEIHSVAKGMKILETLGQHGPLGVTELSRRLNMHKSVVSKILGTMRQHGFARIQPETGRYDLGLRLFALGQLLQDRLPFRRAVMPHVEKLAQEFGETAYVGIWENEQVQYLCDCVSHHPVRLGKRSGVIRSPWHDALGKAILAFWDWPAVSRYLKTATAKEDPQLPTPTQLKRELAAVRRRGYAVEREMHGLLLAVAAPIPHIGRSVTAALAVGGPSTRIEQIGLEQIGSVVAQRAREAALEMGWWSDE